MFLDSVLIPNILKRTISPHVYPCLCYRNALSWKSVFSGDGMWNHSKETEGKGGRGDKWN